MARSTSILSILGAAAAAAVLASTRTAAAQADESVSYDLDYRAPAGCPAEATFTGLIARRTARARRSSDGAGKYRFTVEVALNDAGARGTLRIAERDGGSSERDVPARDCANAIEAMALIAAVILDPRAAVASSDTANATRDNAPPAATVPPAATAPPAASAPPAPERRAPVAKARTSATEPMPKQPAREPETKGAPWRARLRVAGLLQGAVAPGAAFGGAAGVEVFQPRHGVFEPRAALTANFATAETSTPFGNANFLWYAGRVTACPLRWPEGVPVVLRACAFVDAGGLRGHGSNTQNARGSTAFWLAAGPALEVEVEVSSWLGLAVEGGLTVPAFHDSFIFVPQEVAHEVPGVGAWLAVGARFGPL